jgi:tetratricopeptide (TPR) repeat protein
MEDNILRRLLEEFREANKLNRMNAIRLLDKDKPREVIKLAKDYMKKQSQNPYGPWYVALANYKLGKFQDALNWFDRAQELAPNLEKDYINPYRSAIKKKLSERRVQPKTQ